MTKAIPMLYDQVQMLEHYTKLHPLFPVAWQFLQQNDLHRFPDGRYEIQGSDVAIILENCQGRGQQGAVLEAHKKYIDIQISLEGDECIGWSPTNTLTKPRAPFDDQKDIIFYHDTPQVWLPLSPGRMAIFFPFDAHAPLAAIGSVRKAVIKIAY